MLTSQDVRNVQFEKNLRGYRTEEVDRFLDKVEEQLRQDDALAEELRKQIADLTAENQRLHEEMKNYEADGDMLKSALINAQRMGENVIREANQKSEEILHRANLRGDDIIRDANELLQKASDRADEIINEANDKKLAEEREYDRVRLEVTRFKSDVLNLPCRVSEPPAGVPEGGAGGCRARCGGKSRGDHCCGSDRGDRAGTAGDRCSPCGRGNRRGRQERGFLVQG